MQTVQVELKKVRRNSLLKPDQFKRIIIHMFIHIALFSIR